MPIRFRVSLIGALAILTMLIAGCYPLQEEFVLIPTPVAPSESEAASETAAPEAITLEGTVAVNALRVRQRASAETSIIAGLLKDDIISVIGRTEDGSWLQVQVPDVGTIGWVWAEDVTLSGAADTLLVIDDDEMAEETAAEDKADDDEMTEETAAEDKADDGEMTEETAAEDKADDGEMSEETAAEDKADDGEMTEETAAEDKADDGEMSEETAAEDKADDGEMSEETAAEDKADDGEMSEETAAEDKADDGEMTEETAAEDKADDGEMTEETAAEDKADDGEMTEETAAEDKADDGEMTEETAAEDKADDGEMTEETAAEDKADDGEMTEETAAEDKADDGEMTEETAAEDKADDGEMTEETAAEDKADDGEMTEETAAEDKADDGEMTEETAAEDKADDGEMSEETAAEDKADDDEMTEETAAEDKADDDEMAVEYDPSVTVNAQDVVKGKITVAEVVTQVKGWIVIHSDDVGSFGPIIGQSSLEAGVTTDLAVDIDVDAATETLYAMLHIDSGVFDIFEFPGPDNPVLEDSAPISMAFTVTINEMSMAEEGAGEEAMAEESPEETALIAEGDVATQLAIITTRSLRVRSKPETIAEVLAGVTAGEAYPVAGFSADGEWVAIFFPDIDDPVWVSASLVELRDTELIVRLGRFTVATAEDQRLRLRSEPTLEAPIVGHILRGESFSALGVSVDGAWTLLVDAGVDGPTWASTAFLLAEE